MMRRRTMLHVCACAAFVLAPVSDIALAQKPQQQSEQSVPNALQGFSQNKDQPVKIEAASLEVRDKDKVATFSGNVIVTQGDTTMKCKSLLVFYDTDSKSSGSGGSTMKAAQPGPGGSSSIRRLEAKGGVFVTQKEQTATGAEGLFDMKSNTITLSGNVLITQGQNVLKGERLVVDMATGAARVEGGRVSGVFMPGGDKDAKDKDKDKDKDAGKNKESGKAKDTGSKAKTTGKSSNAAKTVDTKSAEEETAPATVPARPATTSAQPAARNTTASTRRIPVTRDASAVVESAPTTQETTPAPAFAPAARGSVATPDRSNPIAPRGIY